MKKGIITLIAITLTFNLLAQTQGDGAQIITGEEFKLKSKEQIDEILGTDDQGIYIVSKDGEKITISKFDHDLVLIKSNEVLLKFGKQKLTFPILKKRGDDIIMFTKSNDKKAEINYGYMQVLNKNTLVFSLPKIVSQISYKGFKKNEAGDVYMEVCENGNFLMVTSYPSIHKEEAYIYNISVLDVDMEEVWKMENIGITSSENKSVRKELYESQFTNSGTSYSLRKSIDKSRKYDDGEIDYVFEMEVRKANEKTPLRFDVTLKDHFITDIKFKELSNGGIQFVGFYSEKGYGQDGSFSILLDANYELVSSSTKEFSVDFMVQHSSERTKTKAKEFEGKGKEIQLNHFNIGEIVENNDGSVTVVAEQFDTYTKTTTHADGTKTEVFHYVYGYIVLVNYNAEGNVAWMELIPKRQHGSVQKYYPTYEGMELVKDDHSSYALMKLNNGNLVLVFNDHPQNGLYDSTNKLYTWGFSRFNTKLTDIVYYKVTDQGKMSRHIINKGDEKEVVSHPSISFEVAPNEMIILSPSKKTKFVKLIFD